MARRITSDGGLGVAVIVALGVAFAVLKHAFEFVAANSTTFLALAGVVGAVALLKLFLRPKTTPAVQAAMSSVPSTPVARQIAARPAARRDERRASPKPTPARWVSRGETVRIQGLDLGSGLFYLGSELKVFGGATNQYAIDPSLDATANYPDVGGSTMHYWPSYADMTPAARSAFLMWMAGGRMDATYGVGHVLLYFYGLEHHVFVEEGADGAAVIAEVSRLLALYPEESSFRDYAEKFLVLASVKANVPLPASPLTPDRSDRFTVDVAVRLHLGRRLLQSPFLNATDALLMAINWPDVKIRAPAVRCFDELVSLWSHKFASRYPNGVEVKHKDKITLSYSAASKAFEVPIHGDHEAYPDAFSATNTNALTKLLEESTRELEAFSRFVARKPSSRASMQGVMLLPRELQTAVDFFPVRLFDQRMQELTGTSRMASTTLRAIVDAAGFDVPEDKVPAALLDQVGRSLDLVNMAFEPDRRYGGGAAQLNDEVFVFRAENGGPVDPERPEYSLTKSEIEVAVLAAAADGDTSADELEHLVRRIGAKAALNGIEKARLIAFAVMIFKSPPKQGRIMKRLAERSTEEKQSIAAAAITLVGSNSRVETSEVQFLEKLHKTLGLPQDKVYADLHQIQSSTPTPPMTATPTAGEQAAATPNAIPDHLGIDAAALAKTQQDTARVSSLLASIFVDEEDPSPSPSPPAAAPAIVAAPSLIPGLDAAHASLLTGLIARDRISREEFDEQARLARLLPDGAIERINEWSFDQFDEALLEEEGGELVITPALREQVAAQRKEAA